MKSALLLLCLALSLTACSTTNDVVIKYKTVWLHPPATYLTPVTLPFNQPPDTYGEAVERDPIWWQSLRQCQVQIEKLRHFYKVSERKEADGN